MAREESTLQLFTVLAAFVEERLGLRYSWDDRSLLLDKVESRALEVGHDSLLQYYYLLRYDDPEGSELAKLAAVLSVGETYLFREPDALFLIADDVIPRVLRERGRARVWCAACSTGEEAFSVALLLEARGVLEQSTVLGTDLSPRAIERARSGYVSPRSLERSPHPQLAEEHVRRVDGGQLRVSGHIRERVCFEVLNLLDQPAVRAQPLADVILLRNVLIYFGPDTTRRVVSALLERLRDDGVLLLGVSESLLRVDLPLDCHEHGGVFYYQKANKP